MRDLSDTPTPIIEAAALDRSRRDNTIRINTLAISDHYPSGYASDSSSSADGSATPSLHLQGFLPVVNSMINRSKSPPENVPDPRAASRRRNVRFKGKCDACGRRGHKATSYEFLDMYLWCQKYMHGRSVEDVRSAMDHWTEKNKEWLGPTRRDPTTIARAHMVATNLTEDQMCQDMCWGILAPDDSEES